MVNGCAEETLLSATGGSGSSQEDAAFDRTVEALQGIVLGTGTHTALHGTHQRYSLLYLCAHCFTRCCTLCTRAEDEFYRLHAGFLAKHCHHFEDCEENKHVYMDVFRSYVRAPLTLPPTHCTHALCCCADGCCREVP